MKFFYIFLICILFLHTKTVSAGCSCRCVNGSVQALCSSTLEIPPICAPRICPSTSPSVKPLPSLKLNPLGTTSCRQKQVLNPYTGLYQWKRVCR